MSLTLGLMIAASATVLGQAPQKTDRPDRPGHPSHEAMVLGFIHQANQNEIALSKLAQTNSSSTEVKDFATWMIDDHTQADSQVTAFADSHKITLPSTKEMKSIHGKGQVDRTEKANRDKSLGSQTGEWQYDDVGTAPAGGSAGFDSKATMATLQGLKGADFDRQYVSAMIKDHQLVIDRLNRARLKMTDPGEVKLIDGLLTTQQDHLTKAQQIQNNLRT